MAVCRHPSSLVIRPRASHREFTKGGLVKGGFSDSNIIQAHIIVNPPCTKPPFVNSRSQMNDWHRLLLHMLYDVTTDSNVIHYSIIYYINSIMLPIMIDYLYGYPNTIISISIL